MNDKYIEMSLFKGRAYITDNALITNEVGPVIDNVHCFATDPVRNTLLMCDLVSLNRIKLLTGWETGNYKNSHLRYPLTPHAYGGNMIHKFISVGFGINSIFYSDYSLMPNKPEYRLRLALNKFTIADHWANDNYIINGITKLVSSFGNVSIYFDDEEAYSKAKMMTNWFDTDFKRGLEVPRCSETGKIMILNDSIKMINKHEFNSLNSYYYMDDMHFYVADFLSSLYIELI